MRLVLPPWWDELADVTNTHQSQPQSSQNHNTSNVQQTIPVGSSIVKGTVGPSPNTNDNRSSTGTGNVMSILVNKPTNSDGNNGNEAAIIFNNRPNSGRTYIRYESQAPLHLHQVIPNLHASDDYYRTQATSPLQTNSQGDQTPHNELVVPGMTFVTASPINEDPRRHSSNRTYEDYGSDDELGREDINFTMDGGKEKFVNFLLKFFLNAPFFQKKSIREVQNGAACKAVEALPV